MAIPARIDAPITGQMTCSPAVPDVLGGFHQCRLDQEGRHEADERADDSPDDIVGQVEKSLDDSGHEIDTRGDDNQVGGVRPVHPPGLAECARKWIHWRRIPPPGCMNADPRGTDHR
jgi:hypothetical protein